MKRTIITTLKFFDSCLEIEAVEYTSKGIFPIFLNSINSKNSSDLEQKGFIRDSKIAIEKLIKGKITELIVIVSNKKEIELKTSLYNFEFSLKQFKNTFCGKDVDTLLNKDFKKNSKYIIDSVLVNQKTVNDKLYVVKSITTISNDFYNKIVEFTSQNKLNIAKIMTFDFTRSQNFNTNKSLFIDIYKNVISLNYFSKNILTKSEILEVGLNDVSKHLIENNFVQNTSDAYMIVKKLLSNNFNNILIDGKIITSEKLKLLMNSFYDDIFSSIKKYIANNKMANGKNQLTINLFVKPNDALYECNSYKELIKDENSIIMNVVPATNNFDVISSEMNEIIRIITNMELSSQISMNEEKLLTTETFVVDTTMLRNSKSFKRKVLYI